jgi:hypothetical protein
MLWDVNFLWRGKRYYSADDGIPVVADTAAQALGKLIGRHFPSRQVGLISSVNMKEGTWHARQHPVDPPCVAPRSLTQDDDLSNWPAVRW